MDFGLATETISQIQLDFGVTFVTSAGSCLRIETTFAVTLPGTSRIEMDPNGPDTLDASIFRLLHREILKMETATDSGFLTLGFADATVLEVAADDEFEAWSFAGADGSKVVCTPGGDLVAWDADASPA